MDRKLLNKYFRDQCTEKELDKVLDWFQTEEGQAFLEQDMEQLRNQTGEKGDLSLYPEVETDRVFHRIQLSKKKEYPRNRWIGLRIASMLLLVGVLLSLLYWSGVIRTIDDYKPKTVYTSYVTGSDQQKVLTLSDGTKIRLNERAKLIVPEKFDGNRREVELKGEAYFEVESNQEHPFLVRTTGSVVEVLGTKFNVKADSAAGNVQVAVIEGKVALKSGYTDTEDAASALLTRNNFGEFRLSDSQITIEKGNTENYLSWFRNRLIFSGETLGQVSRQLERLYNIEIEFKNNSLKNLSLTANMEKLDLREVLSTISDTFGIRFKIEENHVVWFE